MRDVAMPNRFAALVSIAAFVLVTFYASGAVAGDVATRMYRNNPAGTGELLAAVEFESLELAWAHPTTLATGSDRGYLVPIVGKGKLYYATQGNVECLNASTGKVVWHIRDSEVRFNPQGLGDKYNGIGHVVSVCEGTVLVPTDNGKLFGLDASDGRRRWVYETEGWITNAVVDCQTVYFTDARGVIALNCSDGRELWRLDVGGIPEPECMVVVADQGVYYATKTGKLHKATATTGKLIWSATLWERGNHMMVNGTFCSKDGVLYVSTIGLEKHHGVRKKILKINADDGAVISTAPIGSDRTRTGLQTDGKHLIVFGLHNPGCVRTEDFGPIWRIRRAATSAPEIANSYDMQYGGATIVGRQIMYVNYLKGAPFWVTDITTGRAIMRIRKPDDEDFTTRAFRAPSGYFKTGTKEGWMYVGAGGGILAFKGRCVNIVDDEDK